MFTFICAVFITIVFFILSIKRIISCKVYVILIGSLMIIEFIIYKLGWWF